MSLIWFSEVTFRDEEEEDGTGGLVLLIISAVSYYPSR
jgi:hypothetical protein